jgi:hypothetical protein
MNNRLIKSNDAGGGACTNTVDLYNPFPDGGGVALYQLNGDATDVSGNYDGTATNVTYGTGEFGQAGVFNGSSSFISNTSISGFPLGSSERTLSFWVNAQGSGVRVIGGYGNAATAQYFGLSITASNGINFLGYSYNLSTTYTIPQNEWVNIVTTYNGTTQLLYANGVQVYSAARTYNTGSSEFRIGDDLWGTTERFDGSIDQVRVFNRALRPYEVEALYTEEYCTPTIVPSEHFNTVLYTAATTNGTYDITGVGFQPDFIWVKNRDNVEQHYLIDSVRGLTNMTDKFLQSSTTNSESAASLFVNGSSTPNATTVSAIEDGFRVVETTINSGELYFNGRTYVSWNFKAGGAAVSNTEGTITSQVSANTEAGFSIVSYTGNGVESNVGHGLNEAPAFIIIKNRTNDAENSWAVWNKNQSSQSQFLVLNSNDSYLTNSGVFGSTPHSSSVFNVGNLRSRSGINYIAYCFAEVEGFSNFGSYVGNGSTSGNVVVTGFEPAFLMIKGTDQVSDWIMLDNKRDTTNPNNARLDANSSDVEFTGENLVNFLENGFELVTASASKNGNGKKFIYMAFAADPTTIEPSLEDSFNTVLYNGNGGTQSVTGVGFEPSMVWIKSRSISYNHTVYDSVRGVNRLVLPNLTNAEIVSSGTALTSFDNDGFTIGLDAGINQSGNNYVAWNWKGAELPAINSNGSIPSVVSANPAAGFSIVSYTGNGSDYPTGASIGHGLSSQPKIIIVKDRTNAGTNWAVLPVAASDSTAQVLLLNDTGALTPSGTADSFNKQLPTSSLFYVGQAGGGTRTNGASSNYIAYCFAELQGSVNLVVIQEMEETKLLQQTLSLNLLLLSVPLQESLIEIGLCFIKMVLQ